MGVQALSPHVLQSKYKSRQLLHAIQNRQFSDSLSLDVVLILHENKLLEYIIRTMLQFVSQQMSHSLISEESGDSDDKGGYQIGSMITEQHVY